MGSLPPSPSASAAAAPSSGDAGASMNPAVAAGDLPGRGALRGGDWLVLPASVALALGGVVLAARLRPRVARHVPDDTTLGGEPR